MLRFIFMFELLFAALLIYFVSTQIIIPILRGTPILPWLEDESKLSGKLRHARQDIVEAELAHELFETKVHKRDIKASTRKGR